LLKSRYFNELIFCIKWLWKLINASLIQKSCEIGKLFNQWEEWRIVYNFELELKCCFTLSISKIPFNLINSCIDNWKASISYRLKFAKRWQLSMNNIDVMKFDISKCRKRVITNLIHSYRLIGRFFLNENRRIINYVYFKRKLCRIWCSITTIDSYYMQAFLTE